MQNIISLNLTLKFGGKSVSLEFVHSIANIFFQNFSYSAAYEKKQKKTQTYTYANIQARTRAHTDSAWHGSQLYE